MQTILFHIKKTTIILSLLIFLCSTSYCFYPGNHQKTYHTCSDSAISLPVCLNIKLTENTLSPTLQYKHFNKNALKKWLTQKNSLLATEPYFSTIINTAKSYNINPLLLFSITGQEQNFVPKTNEYATQIGNNPFNLYGSWEAYNTSIEEAAKIVSRTIIHLSENCPEGEDQIKWINLSYAADPDWHIGVSYFLNELESITALSRN